MPVCEVHLVEGDHSDAQLARLLRDLSERYAAVLESPIERVRVLLTMHRPAHAAVGGVTGGPPAPYFTALVLTGRPDAQRHRLLAELTDLLVDTLGVERSRVRGRIVQVPPGDWGIGGEPASAARADEIAARSR